MTVAVEQQKQAFLDQLARLQTPETGPSWLKEMRNDALALVRKYGLPTTQVESWRYTELKTLTSVPFALPPQPVEIESAKNLPKLESDAFRLVFCNGHFSPDLSSRKSLPQGVQATPLSEILKGEADVLKEHLSKGKSHTEDVFVALNLSFLSDGIVLEIPEGVVVEETIHLVFLNEVDSAPTMIHPRIVILSHGNSQLRVVESHLGLNEAAYFSNPVTEIVASENAVVDYYKLQREGANCHHIGTVDSLQGRNASVRTGIFTLGGRLVRNNTKSKLDGEGGFAELNGLFLVSQDQHVDNYTTIEHAKPHCSSRELYKGILDQNARGVFRGRIVVAEGAQKTDSKQTNNNLLLSDDALVNAKPQLEIYADDVKCTHGATIGQVEDEAMFYLRARGIGREAARSMLIYAFASEVVNEIKLPALQKELDELLFDWLPGGALVRK
jgi:Fe-S cluster assembly protein SufD